MRNCGLLLERSNMLTFCVPKNAEIKTLYFDFRHVTSGIVFYYWEKLSETDALF